jgi:hypothetical protein
VLSYWDDQRSEESYYELLKSSVCGTVVLQFSALDCSESQQLSLQMSKFEIEGDKMKNRPKI